MRTAPGQLKLQEWLIEIGEGRHQETAKLGPNGAFIPIPDELVVNNLDSAIDFCFPPELFRDPMNNARAISENGILCPKNIEVDQINEKALLRMDGIPKIYTSIDRPLDSADPFGTYRADNNIETLHNECPSGMPAHKLILKVHLIMLLIWLQIIARAK